MLVRLGSMGQSYLQNAFKLQQVHLLRCPISGLKEVDYLTSTTLLELKNIPKQLTVIYSGYIGMELGQLFHHLGSEITLMQRSERLIKEYDPELSESVEKALIEQGINLVKGANFERVEQSGEIKRVYVTVDGSKEVIESDQLLVAIGGKSNTDSFNLSAAGVETGKNNEILINDFGQTSNENIYAAGDVIYAVALAVKFGLTVEDLRETLAPYLTMADGLKLAALTFDKDVSKLSCCAG